MAVRITSPEIGSLRGLSDAEASDRVRSAIRAANDAIFERTLSEHDKRGMGTTATVLVLMQGRYLIGQVGDSRAYLLRNGRAAPAHQGPLLRAGAGGRRAAHAGAGPGPPLQQRDHPLRRRQRRRRPGHLLRHLEQGDVLLLASDGLTGMLEDEQLDRGSSAPRAGPQHWVDRMITEANRRGGLDNITAIVVRIESVDSNTGETPAVPAAASGAKDK